MSIIRAGCLWRSNSELIKRRPGVRAVDTDRAFINMVLTKGEADQRGSRRARCVCRGAFQDGTMARGRRDGKHTPSNGILTKNKLVLLRERNKERQSQIERERKLFTVH